MSDGVMNINRGCENSNDCKFYKEILRFNKIDVCFKKRR